MAEEDALTQRMIDKWPWCHWYEEQPWWRRGIVAIFGRTDWDAHTGMWLSLRGHRYYFHAETLW